MVVSEGKKIEQLSPYMRISCYIKGVKVPHAAVVKGKYGSLYICQNIMKGSDTINKLGYNFSWCVVAGSSLECFSQGVTEICLISEGESECAQCGKPIKKGHLCRNCFKLFCTYKCKGCGRVRRISKKDPAFGVCGVCLVKLPKCYLCGKPIVPKFKFSTGELACHRCKSKEFGFKQGVYKTFAKMKEEKTVKDYIGFELELECKTNLRIYVRDYLNKSGKIVGFISRILEHLGLKFQLFCSTDGSLIDGIEFQSIPCTYNYLTKKFRLKKLFSHLMKYFYSNRRCGLHFHMSRETITNLEIIKMMYFLSVNEVFLRKLSRREKVNYCRSINRDNIFLGTLSFPTNKFNILNPTSKTVELRMFQAPNNYTEFMQALQFTELLRIYVKRYSVAFCKKPGMYKFKEEAKRLGFNYLYRAL